MSALKAGLGHSRVSSHATGCTWRRQQQLRSRRKVERAAWRRRATSKGLEDTEIGKLASIVSDELKGISVYVNGPDITANKQLAGQLGPLLGAEYTCLSTDTLVESISKSSVPEIISEHGYDGLREAESAVLKELSTHIRLCVATIGAGGGGALSDPVNWRYVHGALCIWHGSECPGGERLAEVVAPLESSVLDVLKQCRDVLTVSASNEQSSLAKKKSMYIKLGCRGDWPDIQPPGWDPDGDSPKA